MISDFQSILDEQHKRYLRSGATLTVNETAERIATLSQNLASFWSKAEGWAPPEVATLLNTARLDRIASLARSLGRWSSETELSDGDLVLGWANLGSVMEGVLKLFLSVYLDDYRSDSDVRRTRAFNMKKQILSDPDGLTLDGILGYLDLARLLADEQLRLARKVQMRRNAIHAFRDRELGTTEDLHEALRMFRAMLCSLNARLPYPDCLHVSEEMALRI